MTSPDLSATPAAAGGNSDAPVADVPWGKTEYVTVIASVGSLLNGYLGHDYGLSKNASALSVAVGGLMLLSHNVSRALKHRAAMRANAATYAAQLEHVAAVLTAGGGAPSITDLAAGVKALNSAVVADTPPDPPPAPPLVAAGGAPVSSGAPPVDPPAIMAMAGTDGMAIPVPKKAARRR